MVGAGMERLCRCSLLAAEIRGNCGLSSCIGAVYDYLNAKVSISVPGASAAP
jgi:hypothetical protein